MIARRSVTAEAATLIVLTVLAVAAFAVTKAPLYNPRWSIDPWLYTALWTNFDQIYPAFRDTYYASRIPWVAPGYALNQILDPRSAALALHGFFFFAGGACMYLLCRRFFGWVPAAVAYIGLVGSQMYFGAHRWDYWEGAVITLLAASVYFATPLTCDRRVRALSLGLAGFLAAALITTLIFALVFLLGLPALYAIVLLEVKRGARMRRFVTDLAAFGIGAIVLIVVCGLFARAHGGPFAFFMPQIHTALTANVSVNKQPLDAWLPREPRFFVPLFVVAIATVVLAARRLDRLPQRALGAAAFWTGGVFVVLWVWRFAGDGFFFEYVWYFSMFLVSMLVCVAGVAAGLVRPKGRLSLQSGILVAASAAAVLVPLLWLYRRDDTSRFADGMGYDQYLVMGISMTVALAGAVIVLALRRTLFGVGLAVLVTSLFATSYGLNVSYGTYLEGASDPVTGELYDLGQSLIAHLHDEGFDEELPSFWYDVQSGRGVAGALQSLYYYSYTYVGVSMPTIDEDFRNRMAARPQRLVLLCEAAGCGNGPAALRDAGYSPQLESRKRLDQGQLRIWVEIYALQYPQA